jgi:hypothetical protein
MIKGYWEKRIEKRCESFYLIDDDKNISYTFEITAHKSEPGTESPSTDIRSDNLGIINAMAESLQMGGYIPKSAVDAELSATKYHLEDMRKLTLKDKGL